MALLAGIRPKNWRKAATITVSSRSFLRHFAGHFLSENWPFAHFCPETGQKCSKKKLKNRVKMAKNWPFAHFLPTFIFKSGQAETLVPQGFAGFLATFPLFLFT